MSLLRARLQQELARIRPATILIVEPDPVIAALLCDHLSDYQTHVVGNGRDARTYCQQTPPDLILIDTALPDTDALKLFQQLLPVKFTNHIPIFFLGQLGDDRDQRMKALEIGVDDYISKPFDIVELHFRVKNALPGPAQSVDLVTGMPGWPAIHTYLQRRLTHPDWTLIFIHVAYMSAYHDLYGAIAGQRARRTIATMLHDLLDQLGELDDIIGTLSEPEFVIITASEHHGRMINLIERRFQAEYHNWYSPQEVAVGRVQLPDGRRAPLMTPTTAVVTGRTKTFAATLDVIEAAEALRQQQYPNISDTHVSPFHTIFITS